MNNNEYVTARLVLMLANTIVSERNTHIAALDITTAQADALIFFYEYPDSTITSLKNEKHVQHATAQMLIHRLAKKGLIALTVDPRDRRARIIKLTPEGLKMRKKLKINGSHTGERLLEHFTEDEGEQFNGLLERAIRNIIGEE